MRLGTYTTGIPPGGCRTTAITAAVAAVAIVLATSSPAVAESSGVVMVTGKVGAHERGVIEAAVVKTVRRASWSLSSRSFAPPEIDVILKCLRDDQPWPCLAPVMEPKGLDRIVVADASPPGEAMNKIIITGQLAMSGDGAAAIVQRRCDGCDDTQLATVAQRLAEQLLRDYALHSGTVLELQTRPSDATVMLDGQLVGPASTAGKLSQPAAPGAHKLTVQREGFVSREQTIDLPAAKTTEMTVELAHETEEPRGSLVIPIASGGAGVAAIAVGSYLIYLGQQDGPEDRRRYTRATAIGVVTGLAGLAAVGYSAYLFWLAPRTSGPALSAVPGGLTIGWAGAL